MKLLLMSNPNFFIEEDKIVTTLFEEGLDIMHLRKPHSEPVFCERLLTLLPDEYHAQIVTNDHFYLKEEFNLMGIHLSHHNSEMPKGYMGTISRTCYTLDELRESKNKGYQYVILKNVFDSISEPNYTSRFTLQELHEASRQGLIDRHVMAQGGVALENIPQLRDLGFGGIVVRGDIWKRFNIHNGQDYKEVITHFRKLRREAG